MKQRWWYRPCNLAIHCHWKSKDIPYFYSRELNVPHGKDHYSYGYCMLSQPTQAAITKYHKLGAIYLFLTVLEAGSQRSRHQQVQCLDPRPLYGS